VTKIFILLPPNEYDVSNRHQSRIDVSHCQRWMSATVNTEVQQVGRWEPDSRGRLREAAFELYAERGHLGVAEPHATLAAEAGTTVLRVAIEEWANDDRGRELPALVMTATTETVRPDHQVGR
jgi:hypothetical protein